MQTKKRKNEKNKITAILVLLSVLIQILVPILPTEVLATGETETEIGKEYEIKEEEEWDISINRDGSVLAKWTRKDKTIVISGTGKMKNWSNSAIEDWHGNQYTKFVEKVIILEGVTSIGEYAFKGCSSLRSITIPEGVTSIAGWAVYGCSSLTSITIPEGVTSIGEYAFYGCSSLTSIVIPEGVTSIGGNVFNGCSSLINIEIPEGVTSIRGNTFTRCSSLTSITIPASVTSIVGWAFYGCSSLTSIDVDENNVTYSSENGILFNKLKTSLIKYPEGKKDNTIYEVPEGITSIGSDAFYKCSSLTSIVIPEGVTSIGSDAFYKCSSLTSIVIPEGVTSIGDGAFNGCSSLTSIVIPEGVTSIGDGAFKGCSSLTSITIPASVTSIGSHAFSMCSSLTSITIPASVTSIGNEAIDKTAIIYVKADSEGHRYAEKEKQGYILEGQANNLTINYEIKEEEEWDISENQDGSVMAKWTRRDKTVVISGIGQMKVWSFNAIEDWHNNQYTKLVEKVVISEGITRIGMCAFDGCSSLTSITIPASVTSIAGWAFDGCSSLRSITIPEGVTSIGGSAFNGCSSLTSIVIPEGVTSMVEFAFYECSSLTSITIPASVTSIGSDAFSMCSSLTSITIPASVTSIGGAAFKGCSSLTSITIPASVTSIGEKAFDECSSLTSIDVDENNAIYSSENGILFNKLKTSLIKYPEGKKDNTIYEIPEGVTSIGGAAFKGCSSLTSITIPASVTSIGEYAFYKCSSLTSIVIPASVSDIGDGAIDKTAIIYVKADSEGHRYAEEGKQGYILDDTPPNITNIDKQAPTTEVRYNTTEATNQNVTVTIKANEALQELEGWNLSQDKLTLTKEYSENTTEEITVKDLAGNETKVNINITNIDKQAPTTEVSYNITEATNQNVTVTIKANEALQELEGWNLSQDKLTLTKEYSENTTEEITVKDLTGNETKVSITITNIDHTIQSIKKGDLNNDAKIDTTDLLKILRHIATSKSEQTAQKYPSWILTGDGEKAADINGDGKIDTTDTLKLLRHMAASKSEETANKYPDWIIQ